MTVTPDAKFTGTLTVRYTVRDATGDPDRDVDGRIVLNVRGRPAAPWTPRNLSVGDGRVVATWTSVLDTGGLPVLRYWVTAAGTNGDRVRQECPTTTCTVTALRNAVEYTLTVTAENQLG